MQSASQRLIYKLERSLRVFTGRVRQSGLSCAKAAGGVKDKLFEIWYSLALRKTPPALAAWSFNFRLNLSERFAAGRS